MIVVMNKYDKTPPLAADKFRKRFNKILKQLNHARGSMTHRIEIMPCVLVTNPEDKKLVTSIVTRLAKHLQ